MPSPKQRLLSLANAALRPLGIELVPSWRMCWWMQPGTFAFGGRQLEYFYHPYNCGWPPYASERSVELALANFWLGRVEAAEVVEVGAVTPYYWPGRVRRVIDPFDPHSLVTDRRSMFQTDLTGQSVLSVSTFEHIGMGDYGLQEAGEDAREAFAKLFAESPRFLVTVPAGYNRQLDAWLESAAGVPGDVSLRHLERQDGCVWSEVPGLSGGGYGDPALQRRFPGTSIGQWANGVRVLERGGMI